MTIKKKFEGELYTPEGHDNTVTSRKLFNPKTGTEKMDCHVTTFTPGASMDEETHEFSDHVFFMLAGTLEVLQGGEDVGVLEVGDSVYIPAGEAHQIRNLSSNVGVFLAVTVPPC